jgi:dienelactone hydrolase
MIIFGFIAQISFADSVEFKSSSKGKDGTQLILTGILKKPYGDGPFPAIVLLHGAAGFEYSKTRTDAWSKRLVSWGYVTLAVDSMGPRGMEDLHGNHDELFGMLSVRAFDAYDAKSFLSSLPFVTPNNIAVMGWSHGGMTVLYSVIKLNVPRPLRNREAFKVGISFYPYCDEFLTNTNAPLLILHGELDKLAEAESCLQFMVSKPKKHEIILKIYPEAYHGFDWEGKDANYRGHKVLYNQKAAKDAEIQVKDFLKKYLE